MNTIRKTAHKAEGAFDKAKLKVKKKLNLFDPVIIYPYYGYGNEKIAYLRGRILEKERMIHEDQEPKTSLWHNLYKIWKRFESDEIPGVGIEGELHGFKACATSDEEGYFELVFKGMVQKELSDGWHEVKLQITFMPYDLEYQEKTIGSVLICNQENSFGIISDVDDTIVESKAMHTFKKLRLMLTRDAKKQDRL